MQSFRPSTSRPISARCSNKSATASLRTTVAGRSTSTRWTSRHSVPRGHLPGQDRETDPEMEANSTHHQKTAATSGRCEHAQILSFNNRRSQHTNALHLRRAAPRRGHGSRAAAKRATPEAGRSPARSRDRREAPDANPEPIPTEKPSRVLNHEHNQAAEATAGFAEQKVKMNLALQADNVAQINATNPPFAIAEQEVQADLSMQHNQASEATTYATAVRHCDQQLSAATICYTIVTRNRKASPMRLQQSRSKTSPLPSSDRMEWINAEQINSRPQS